MVVAQWMPSDGEHVGPISTGPAVALLGIGGVVVVAAGLVAALSWRERGGTQRVTGWLFGLGLSMCLLGGVGLLTRHSEDQQVSDGLHAAGRQVISAATDSARNCATAPPQPAYAYPSGLLPGGAATYTPPPCSTSPRVALLNSTVLTSLGPYRAQQAASFDTTGQVTVTDPDSGKQVCATVPDTADGTGAVVDGRCG
ncbi:hypothetical protein OG689_43745 [Kitasatospora sp. NBC_00240]|uniref:hypothetical protein n=1 Tax=Kitasatospora sp. NBC_00240 TaxID=2903567 RepID=UPI00225BA32C|nr:hypothetical protein [Kitasatospora sp. NBC_00240]MCX5216050.1 hypothetical protein [Kitasatospora sp. NBC_00240]